MRIGFGIAAVLLGALVIGLSLGSRSPDLEDPHSFEVVRMDFGMRPLVLTPEQQKTDLDFLLRGMSEVYAGQKVDPKLFADFVRKMRGFQADGNTDMTAEDFYYLVQFEVAMLEDGHLQFGYWKQQVQENAARAPAVGQDYASREIHDSRIGKVHVFRMPTFNPPEWEQADRIVRMVEESLPTADALIFDLRGNVGGYGFIPQRIAAALWGVPYRENTILQNFPQPILETGRIGGPYAHALIKNAAVASGTPYGRYVARQMRGSPWDWIETLYRWNDEAEFRKRWDFDVKNPPETEREVAIEESRKAGLTEKGFRKPIFVVVNRRCASACEMFLESLEEHPFASSWGERTMGAVQFGTVMELVLPHSQLTVSLPTSYTIYRDGRTPDRTGYAPEYILDPAAGDPVAHIEALIQKGQLPASKTKKGPRTGAL